MRIAVEDKRPIVGSLLCYKRVYVDSGDAVLTIFERKNGTKSLTLCLEISIWASGPVGNSLI